MEKRTKHEITSSNNYTLYSLRIFVKNLAVSVAFYQDVLGMEVSFLNESTGWAQIKLDSEIIFGLEVLDPSDEEFSDLVGRFTGISFQIQNMEEVFQKLLEKGVEFSSEPKQQEWGAKMAHFRDPDGNELSLIELSK